MKEIITISQLKKIIKENFWDNNSKHSLLHKTKEAPSEFEIKNGKLIAYRSKNAESIVIPDGVTTITDDVITYSDKTLKTVIIPDSVEVISNSAFEQCVALTTVKMGNGVKKIGNRAFASCHNLTSIIIPESVTRIGEGAFAYSGITSITIPSKVKKINEGTFERCKNLTSVTILGPVKSIEDDAFYECQNLKSIKLPNSLTFIGYGAFKECKNLKSIAFPPSMTSIGNGAFNNCSNLTSISFPLTMTTIECAFSNCTSLKSVVIPDSVTTLGRYAFFGCSNLTDVKISNSLLEQAQVNLSFGDTPFGKKLELTSSPKNYLFKNQLKAELPKLKKQYNEKQIEFFNTIKQKIKSGEVEEKYVKKFWGLNDDLKRIGEEMKKISIKFRHYKAFLLWMKDKGTDRIHKLETIDLNPSPYVSYGGPFSPLNEIVKGWGIFFCGEDERIY